MQFSSTLVYNQHKRMVFSMRKISSTRQAEILDELEGTSTPERGFFVLLLFSSAVASFGLIADLSVVTIGAQLIDPLISPILSLSVASVTGSWRRFMRAFAIIFLGATISIALSALISFLAYRLPNGIHASIPAEIMAGTVTTPFDLAVALMGGAAASYAVSRSHMDTALHGVAIATAIMPPLCTIGFGIAFQNSLIIQGALVQFVTNLTGIVSSAVVTFSLLGFSSKKSEKVDKHSRSLLSSAVMLLIITVPLALMVWTTVASVRMNWRIRNVIMDALPVSAQPQLVDLEIHPIKDEKSITATLRMVRELSPAEFRKLYDALAEQLDGPFALRIITMPMEIIE